MVLPPAGYVSTGGGELGGGVLGGGVDGTTAGAMTMV
jgi:hypothetical protein